MNTVERSVRGGDTAVCHNTLTSWFAFADGVHLSLSHHYRGSKMALWLELIPKLHKSDHLDARYHQLDDWDNLTSFEAQGTRLTSRSDLLTTTRRPRPTTTTSTAAATPSSSPTTTTATTTTSTTTVGVASSTLDAESAAAGGDASSLSADVNTVSLSITIAVGSFLLFVNILVFVAVYYQKDRIRRERRRHKADLRAAAASHHHRGHDELDGIVARTDSLSSDVRSQLSLPYGYTSTADDYRPNHIHHQTLPPRLTSPPGHGVDAPAYGTVRSRAAAAAAAAVPRWSAASSDQVDLTTTGGGPHTYSECAGHNGGLGLVHKCAALSTTPTALGCFTNVDMASDDARKPSTVV